MSTRIIYVSGNPWDHGKDMLSRLLIEHLLLAGKPVLLIEPFWDRPKLSITYSGWLESLEIPLWDQASAKAAMDQLPNLIEHRGDRHVLINLPGGSIETIQWAIYERIRPLEDRMSIQITMAYVLGPSERSHDHLEAAWELGLGSVADDCVAVLNGYYGSSHAFFWRHSFLRRDGWLPMGEGEHVMQRMSATLVAASTAHIGRLWPGQPSCMTGLSPRQEAGLRRWLGNFGLASRILDCIPSEDGEDAEPGSLDGLAGGNASA